ncbi:glycosyltransferase family 2 protein [Patescibacteria group bacterium]|nr:glycosyltransferase family 2 protein [Patescibacteria group bacterium]
MENTISAIIIAKNEEERIADCIDSVAFCDEIIVVDNDSCDRTSEIAQRMGAGVYEIDSQNFSEIRNFGLEKAKGNWILYVDADERISNELQKNIQSQISNLQYSSSEAYRIKRKNFYLGGHEWPYIEYLERLFKRENLKGWKGEVHESPVVKGKIGELDGFLLHYTHRDLTSMLEKTIEWSKVEAELRFKAGHPKMTGWRFARVMTTAFWNSYIRQKGYKAGTVGVIESIYQSFSMFVTYARLWEMQQKTV